MASIIITGKDASVTSRNKDHAEEKLSRLAKYFDGIGKIEAILGHNGDDAEVEVVITVPRGTPIVCSSRARDLYAAIDLVLDKAEAQLTKHKERLKDHKLHRGDGAHKPGIEGKNGTPAGEEAGGAAGGGGKDDDGLESYDEVIEKRDFD